MPAYRIYLCPYFGHCIDLRLGPRVFSIPFAGILRAVRLKTTLFTFAQAVIQKPSYQVKFPLITGGSIFADSFLIL
jgi:hypothetical protein